MNRELKLDAKSVKEAIEIQQKKEGYKPKPVKPLVAPVPAKSHTPIYKMHRYYARRPYNLFAKLVSHYSNPGDLILDPFCGGGVTLVEALRLRRKVIGIDINTLATWITRMEVEPVDLDILDQRFKEWFSWIEENVRDLYRAKCTKCNKMADAEWFEWSNVVICPYCKEQVVLANTIKHSNARYECTNKECSARLKPDDCDRKPDKLISVLINCKACQNRYIRPTTIGDVRIYNSISKMENKVAKKEKLVIPADDFPDMNSVRENNLFNKGFFKFRDYFTARQRIALGRMKKWIKEQGEGETIQNCLLLLFSGALRFVNKMVIRSEAWRGDKPLEWAGHIYWPPYTYLEASPIDPLRRRYAALRKGKAEQQRDIGNFCQFPSGSKPWTQMAHKATCWILTQSSHDMKIPDQSVDVIITDPPFGGNVQYGELSDFYLVWIKEFVGLENGSEKDNEAIETRHQNFDGAKDRNFYEKMLFKIFRECRRVIKPEGWLVLTFHNRDVGVWMAMNRAAIRAGFRLPSADECGNRGMVYQPPIENYTQTIHQKRTGSMLGDFILSFRPHIPTSELDAIKEHLSVAEEKDLLTKCEKIIRYNGGADETTLMTGLLPYLSQTGLLARLARFDLRLLLSNGQFVFIKKEKKWFLSDMLEESGALKYIDMIPAENLTQQLIFSYLSSNKTASLDELLVVIYSQLVNSYRPQMATIGKVLDKYCRKVKVKGEKRELYAWNPKAKTPTDIDAIKSMQLDFDLVKALPFDHNSIIRLIAEAAIKRNYNVHIGETEQRKSAVLSELSMKLSGLELGLSPDIFAVIKEIDLIILKKNNILAAIEVATTISTFNKAVNDRFRNLLAIAPNLNIKLSVIVSKADLPKAQKELYKPANIKAKLSTKVSLFTINDIEQKEFVHRIMNENK